MCEVEKIMKEARFGKWLYYRNDEGEARWKCSECGKIVKRLPSDKFYCSRCGVKLRLES